MKVGGMNIQFMDKKGKDIESFLYVNVVGWKYSRSDKKLHIEVGKTGGPIDRELVIGTPDGEAIGLLMRSHAKSVAKQLKEEKEEKAAAQEEVLKEAVGQYRIENPVTCREGAELDTESAGTMEAGDIVEVTEAAINTRGTTRLKCESGWFSLKPHLCVKLDADGNEVIPEGQKKIDVTGFSGDSVAAGIGNEAEDLAAEIGMLADATFPVTQTHIKKTPQGKKCPTDVQLKVGGMGLNVFDGPMMVESHLYFAMGGWTYSKQSKSFDIQLKDGKKNIRFGTPDGMEIAEKMQEHTQSLASAKKEAAEAAEAEVEEGEPPELEEDPEYDTSITEDSEGDILLGYWRVENPILVRSGVEVSSDEAGKLEPGDTIKASTQAIPIAT